MPDSTGWPAVGVRVRVERLSPSLHDPGVGPLYGVGWCHNRAGAWLVDLDRAVVDHHDLTGRVEMVHWVLVDADNLEPLPPESDG